ncbi:response regulator [Terricaulis sp.]|uniref:response regulator n=1 Tax=Terricaulis sp. TaxID=2768686 RepID=UPI003783A360
MPRKAVKKRAARTVLLAEQDVIIRLGLATYLRTCGWAVLEAATAEEARAILVAGPAISVLISDAELAGGETGFALATWVRRHRPGVRVILAAALATKTEAVSGLCDRDDEGVLRARIRAMFAERTRRMRKPTATQTRAPRRRLQGP